MLPIALQVYSVREDAQNDFKGTMQRIKDMGYEGVELAGLYGKSGAEIKAVLEEVGLALVSAHVAVEDLQKDAVLAEYASMGLKWIAIPWMNVEANEDGAANAVETIREIAVRCKEHGMQLLYHNHDFEFQKVNGEYILDRFYREVPEDLLKTELDTCWVNVGGENPAAYIKKYAGRVPVLHLKDFIGQKSENMYDLIRSEDEAVSTEEAKKNCAFEYRPLGLGLQKVDELLQAAEEAGTQWLIVEQDEPSMGKSALECVQMSIDYLNAERASKALNE